MTNRPDRRTNHVLRARIDLLLGRIHDARLEIVERGLTAAHPAEPRVASQGAVRHRAVASDRHRA